MTKETNTDDTSRKAFEEWVKKDIFGPLTQNAIAWRAWKAARIAPQARIAELEAERNALRQCSVCGDATEFACSDCRIDFQTSIFVCGKNACREHHERKCSAVLRAALASTRGSRGGET